jgi:hypothetical protein
MAVFTDTLLHVLNSRKHFLNESGNAIAHIIHDCIVCEFHPCRVIHYHRYLIWITPIELALLDINQLLHYSLSKLFAKEHFYVGLIKRLEIIIYISDEDSFKVFHDDGNLLYQLIILIQIDLVLYIIHFSVDPFEYLLFFLWLAEVKLLGSSRRFIGDLLAIHALVDLWLFLVTEVREDHIAIFKFIIILRRCIHLFNFFI